MLKSSILSLRKTNTHTKAMMALAAVCFFWGTTWVASRQGVLHMPALQMAGMRQLFGGLIYLLFFFYKGAVWPTRKQLVPLLVLALLNFVLSNGLSTWGVKYISAGLGSIIGAIFPLWLVIIGFFSGEERLPLKSIIGMLLGFLGVCIIFYEHLADFLQPDFRFGILLSLAATWSWAFGTIYTKKNVASFDPYFGLGIQMSIGGASLLGISYVSDAFVPLHSIPVASWLSIAYLVLFGSVISFIAFIYALQHLPAEQASIYAYVNPMVALLLGALLFDEKLTLLLAIGGAVTVYGVFMVNDASRKNRRKEMID